MIHVWRLLVGIAILAWWIGVLGGLFYLLALIPSNWFWPGLAVGILGTLAYIIGSDVVK